MDEGMVDESVVSVLNSLGALAFATVCNYFRTDSDCFIQGTENQEKCQNYGFVPALNQFVLNYKT